MATARKLPSGSWRVQQYIETVDGKRVYKSFTADTKKDAEFAAAEYALNYKHKQEPANMTVGEAIDRYIESKTQILSPSTLREYKVERRNFLQTIMETKLANLTQEDVQKAVNADAKGHSPKTVRNAHGLLSSALNEFAPDFRLRTKLPPKVKHQVTVPEDESIRKLMASAAGQEMETVILLASALGLRRSEICALTWQDIDLKKKQLTVSKAMVLSDSHEWVIKAPKSYAGTRTLSVPDFVVEHLRGLPHDGERIISIYPDSVTFRFNRLRKECGFAFRFHDLRHYYASIMLALGVPDKYAMERMGHATTNMLKTVYQHVMQGKREDVNRQVNDYLSEAMQHKMQHGGEEGEEENS